MSAANLTVVIIQTSRAAARVAALSSSLFPHGAGPWKAITAETLHTVSAKRK